MCSHRHVISHLPAKFRGNRTDGSGVITSYRFFKEAAIEWEIYFRVQVWWLHSFPELKIYLHTKFRWDISIHGWYKTTSGFWKQTAAILDFYFRFQFLPNFCHQGVILHRSTKFCQNWTTLSGVITLYTFFKMASSSHIGFDLGNVRHPRSAFVGLSVVLKFVLNRIISFWDIAIFILWCSDLKLPIYVHIWGFWAWHISPNDFTHRPNPKRTILARKQVVWAI